MRMKSALLIAAVLMLAILPAVRADSMEIDPDHDGNFIYVGDGHIDVGETDVYVFYLSHYSSLYYRIEAENENAIILLDIKADNGCCRDMSNYSSHYEGETSWSFDSIPPGEYERFTLSVSSNVSTNYTIEVRGSTESPYSSFDNFVEYLGPSMICSIFLIIIIILAVVYYRAGKRKIVDEEE